MKSPSSHLVDCKHASSKHLYVSQTGQHPKIAKVFASHSCNFWKILPLYWRTNVPSISFSYCQRTENRPHKTHVFASVCSQVMKRRGGLGGQFNVPCTSSATCCYAAQVSGSVASLNTWRGGVGWRGHVNVPFFRYCCYAAQMSVSVAGVRWGRGGMLLFLVLLELHVATLHRCLVALLRCIHEGVGAGGNVTVPCTSSATCCYAAQMSGSVASLYTWRGGGGGMLPFLVLLQLHVATLHRCLVVLLRCIHEEAGRAGGAI